MSEPTRHASSAGTVHYHGDGPADAGPVPPATGSRYAVVRSHARGGLGEVFVADDLELGREVALKEILPGHADDVASRRRFLREARLTARLEHPGIVPVHGLGTGADGRPYYAMRLVRGETLGDAIAAFHAGGPRFDGPAFRHLLQRLAAVCNTVAYVHSKGVVHRDLKPANVMLGPFGETLVVDWGLAKEGETSGEARGTGEESGASSSPTTGSSTARSDDSEPRDATRPGSIAGTPAYMSPEQARGEAVGVAADIYGLGATLYTLLTGRAPYEGRDTPSILERVRRGDFPPTRSVQPAAPAALDAVCRKAMAADPARRYASALDLAADLDAWLADEPVSAYREPWSASVWRACRRHRTAVAGLAALGLTALVALGVGIVVVESERRATAAQKQNADEATSRAVAALDLAQRRHADTRQALDAMSSDVVDDLLAQQAELTATQRAFLDKARTYYAKFAADSGDDGATQSAAADAHERVGRILERLGKLQDAEGAYKEAIVRRERLPADPARAVAQAGCWLKIGRVCELQYRGRDAEAAYKKALALTEPFPADTNARRRAAHARHQLGTNAAQSGRYDVAHDYFREAKEARAKLAEENPNDPAFRRDLADSHSNLATLYDVTRRRAEATAEFRAALLLYDGLSKGSADDRWALGTTLNNYGNLFLDSGDFAAAEAEFEKSASVFDRLAADFPGVPEHRRDAGRAHMNRGVAADRRGDAKVARAAYLRALELRELLVAQQPTNAGHRQGVVIVCNNLGLLTRTSDPAESHRWHDRAVRAIEGATPEVARIAVAPKMRYEAHLGRAEALARLKRVDESLPDWEKAIQFAPGGSDGTSNYNAACAAARAAGVLRDDPAKAERFAARAVELLAKAKERGLFRRAAMAKQLREDADLDPLRGRDDFKRLLAGPN